jgi:hypothetical protein
MKMRKTTMLNVVRSKNKKKKKKKVQSQSK